MSAAHYMAEYVHIWYILCVSVRDFACAFVRGVHISSTGKEHIKQRSRTITTSNMQTRNTKFAWFMFMVVVSPLLTSLGISSTSTLQYFFCHALGVVGLYRKITL